MTQSQKPTAGAGRGLKWAFGVSIALNLVFVGLFAGAALRFAGDGSGPRADGPRPQGYGAPYVRALPREDRRALRRSLRARQGDLPSRAERRALELELIAMLRADSFDAEGVALLFAAQTQAAQKVMGHAQNAWLDIVRGMSAPQRAQVAARLEDMQQRRKHHGGGTGG